MKRSISAIASCIVFAMFQLLPLPVLAGYHIFTGCEYGYGVIPGDYPDPNIACELYWEDTGPNFANYAEWDGFGVYIPNQTITASWFLPRFDMRTTAQPLIRGIRCSDVAGEIKVTSTARSFFKEPRSPGYTFYEDSFAQRQGHIGATHPC